MPTPYYISIEGETQSLITTGALSTDSKGASGSVMIDGKPAARVADAIDCGGVIIFQLKVKLRA